ncbi:HdeD family acid-resistance protein [Arthrobacter sp. RCC_34]|uniref:HdeD family acid-resistance protein n=1 Tax=Arthrobacter sp. RCC_34 TaxID=3239230 RepID=UPI003523E1C0
MTTQEASGRTGQWESALLPWLWLLLTGLFSVIVGLLVVFVPAATLATVGMFFGLFLLVNGVLAIVGSLVRTRWDGVSRVLTALAGLLSIALGLMSLRNELQSVLLLATWIGIAWLTTGVARIATGVESRRSGGGWLIFGGAVLSIAGIIVLVSPFSSIVALTLTTGWLLVIGGIVEMVESFFFRQK